eukprot:15454584-Alexandrium_andersonii.AAC.1
MHKHCGQLEVAQRSASMAAGEWVEALSAVRRTTLDPTVLESVGLVLTRAQVADTDGWLLDQIKTAAQYYDL